MLPTYVAGRRTNSIATAKRSTANEQPLGGELLIRPARRVRNGNLTDRNLSARVTEAVLQQTHGITYQNEPPLTNDTR